MGFYCRRVYNVKIKYVLRLHPPRDALLGQGVPNVSHLVREQEDKHTTEVVLTFSYREISPFLFIHVT